MESNQLSKLENMHGVTVKTETDVMGNGAFAIDFSIDWQKNAPAQKHPLRYSAVENSAIILSNDRTVSEAQLRLPPIPTENNPKDETESKLERNLNVSSKYNIGVKLAKDGDTWTPHIRIDNVRGDRIQNVLICIENIWSKYRRVSKPEGNI